MTKSEALEIRVNAKCSVRHAAYLRARTPTLRRVIQERTDSTSIGSSLTKRNATLEIRAGGQHQDGIETHQDTNDEKNFEDNTAAQVRKAHEELETLKDHIRQLQAVQERFQVEAQNKGKGLRSCQIILATQDRGRKIRSEVQEGNFWDFETFFTSKAQCAADKTKLNKTKIEELEGFIIQSSIRKTNAPLVNIDALQA